MKLALNCACAHLGRLHSYGFAKFPYTSPYTDAFVRICILSRMNNITVYNNIYVYSIYNVIHDRGTEGLTL